MVFGNIKNYIFIILSLFISSASIANDNDILSYMYDDDIDSIKALLGEGFRYDYTLNSRSLYNLDLIEMATTIEASEKITLALLDSIDEDAFVKYGYSVFNQSCAFSNVSVVKRIFSMIDATDSEVYGCLNYSIHTQNLEVFRWLREEMELDFTYYRGQSALQISKLENVLKIISKGAE